MNASNRVDELRKRYHENPKRYFAPLANEYRKTGFVDRAMLLCEKHLAETAGNMNGLVVYGQCLFESGRQADAAAPFESALALDPENLIALRHLGDIARLGGDNAAARQWYERVLELDRRNEEVLELIEQVGGREAVEPPSGPAVARNVFSVASSVSVAPADASFPMGNINIDEVSAPEDTPLVEFPSAPPAPPAPRRSAPVTVVRGAVRALPPDSTAPTMEIPDPSRRAAAAPARRASLMDINFDFGETGISDVGPGAPAAPPAQASLPAPAAQFPRRLVTPERPRTSIATPRPGRIEGVLSDYIAESSERVSAGRLLDLDRPATADDVPVGSLIEPLVEGASLGNLPKIAGLSGADFSTEVPPLPDLETTSFDLDVISPLSGFEPDPDFAETSLLASREPAAFSAEEGIELDTDALGDAPLFEAAVEPLPLVATHEDDGDFETVSLAALSGGAVEIEEEESLPIAETPRTFVTETMAKLYLEQGFRDRAIDVYRQLIEQDPADVGLRERLEKLERPSLGFEPTVDEVGDDAEASPPPNAMLADVSFADVELVTPPRMPTPRAAPVVSAGPTAREFLRAFAERSLTPAPTPTVAGGRAPHGALDALFGHAVAAEDERAAHRLATVGATSGPSGGSALDSLFGEGPSAPLPEILSRHSTPRASERLSFERFFSPSHSEAVSPEATVEEPSATPELEVGPLEEEAPGDDDLDQFQGWLRGLTP